MSPSLCHTFEDVYFSCVSNEKIISICASGNFSPENGYVQYRFGASNKIELEYPAQVVPPLAQFQISHIYGGNLNFIHIKFKSDVYDYVVYKGFPSGVYVLREGRLVVNMACDRGVSAGLNENMFNGLITVPPVAGVDD
ncbi:hypothetical protein [Burkholderia sp. 3C]